MTDKLTPGMRADVLELLMAYRDLSDGCVISRVSEFREEAARREAEARPDRWVAMDSETTRLANEAERSVICKVCHAGPKSVDVAAGRGCGRADCPTALGQTGGSTPDPTPIVERKGLDSADAPFKPHKACKTYDRCRRDGFCDDAWNCSEDKAAPAADDLVKRLRRTVFYEGHGERTDAAEEAADRIEAQAREIAELGADRDKFKWAHEDLMNEREAMFSDNKTLKARVAELEDAVRAGSAAANARARERDAAEAKAARLVEAGRRVRDMIEAWAVITRNDPVDPSASDAVKAFDAALSEAGHAGK